MNSLWNSEGYAPLNSHGSWPLIDQVMSSNVHLQTNHWSYWSKVSRASTLWDFIGLAGHSWIDWLFLILCSVPNRRQIDWWSSSNFLAENRYSNNAPHHNISQTRNCLEVDVCSVYDLSIHSWYCDWSSVSHVRNTINDSLEPVALNPFYVRKKLSWWSHSNMFDLLKNQMIKSIIQHRL